jgi:hypothetical protein
MVCLRYGSIKEQDMSIYKDGKLIAGGSQALPLLSFMWSDHQLNHPSWLNSTTFSWQSGAVYQAAYQHLAADIAGKTLQSETISGTTIQFYLADDGHKICPASQESNVMAIYNATGVAWYYIIDTTNQRFKLPRTKFGFTGIRNGVGGFVEAGLPNITGSSYGYVSNASRGASGALQMSGGSGKDATGGGGWWVENITVSVDASRSSSIYGNSNTVQPKATEMYLYFYVGNFTQTALENTAGLNAELFNNKVDKGHQVIEFQEPTSSNNYTWYRKYADGWVEQGGIVAQTGGIRTINFPITMASTKYQVFGNVINSTANGYCYTLQPRTMNTSNMTAYCAYTNYGDSGSAGEDFWWQVSGMAAN